MRRKWSKNGIKNERILSRKNKMAPRFNSNSNSKKPRNRVDEIAKGSQSKHDGTYHKIPFFHFFGLIQSGLFYFPGRSPDRSSLSRNVRYLKYNACWRPNAIPTPRGSWQLPTRQVHGGMPNSQHVDSASANFRAHGKIPTSQQAN